MPRSKLTRRRLHPPRGSCSSCRTSKRNLLHARDTVAFASVVRGPPVPLPALLFSLSSTVARPGPGRLRPFNSSQGSHSQIQTPTTSDEASGGATRAPAPPTAMIYMEPGLSPGYRHEEEEEGKEGLEEEEEEASPSFVDSWLRR